MRLEHRLSPAARSATTSARASSGGRTIQGYAAVFFDGTPATEYELAPKIVERVMPGAFDKTLREDNILALLNHDRNLVLGRTTSRTLRLSVDQRGLKYEIDLPESRRDVFELIARRDVAGASFGFGVMAEAWKSEGPRTIRELRAVRLFDVGPVAEPAYPTTTAAVRAARRLPMHVQAKLIALEVCNYAA